jgi:predicted nucleotidyltransferase
MLLNEIKKLTSHQDINNILIEWVENAENILGDNLVGLYLTGSLAYGDFVPKRSDIDLQAVTRNELTPKELKSIEQLHKNLEKSYPAWANRIECSYVPLKIIRDVLPPKEPRPWWGFGVFYPTAPAGNEWIINQYQLYNHGINLIGPDFKSLIESIDIKEVQKASARDLFTEWEPKINDSEWLENSHYQSYLVLNLCRILCTVIGNNVASKEVSAKWVKQIYPEWKDLIEIAESWRYGIEMKEKERAIEFIKFAIAKVKNKNIL